MIYEAKEVLSHNGLYFITLHNGFKTVGKYDSESNAFLIIGHNHPESAVMVTVHGEVLIENQSYSPIKVI